MLSLIFILVFVLCLAIAVGCIMLSHQLSNTHNTDFHKNYFYYLITFFAFAFYGIWAQVLLRGLLSFIEIENEKIQALANFLPLLGLPFLFISWLMLIKMAHSLVEIKPKFNLLGFHLAFFLFVILSVFGLYSLLGRDSWALNLPILNTEIAIVLFIELSYLVFFSYIIYRFSKNISKKYTFRFALLIVLGFIIRASILPFAFGNPWLFAPLILLYFISNFIPLFYLKLNADNLFVPISVENPNEEKMKILFIKYEITKREKEIIEQICLGKTNQQVADTLFISLQTVKDHTHRIYSKIGINSRMKLVQMING